VIAAVGTNNIKNLTLHGNICRNNLTSGIGVTSTSTFTIDGLSITGNQCPDNVSFGVFVAEATVGAVTRTIVSGNVCQGNGTDDIRVDNLDAVISDNLYTTEQGTNWFTFTDADTTPSVLGGRETFRAANTAATSITAFDDAVDGRYITIYASNGNTTIVNSGTMLLKGATNTTIPSDGIIRLWFDNTVWREVSRSY